MGSFQGVLHWVDIPSRKLYTLDPGTGIHKQILLNGMIGVAVPRRSGGFVLAIQDGFYTYEDTAGAVKLLDPEEHLPGNRFNDGKCDAAGRFWAGTLSMSGEKGAGSLYCLDTDLRVRKAVDQVSIANGLGWSPDNKVMYFIDSAARQVTAYDYDLARGSLSNPRTAVALPEGNDLPDGMTVDAEGMIWIAHWGGGQVTRWNPGEGTLLERITLPVSLVTSCTFGGDRLDELYITSAKADLSDKEREEQPLAGGLFRLKTRTTGLPAYPFGG
ncbi:SMP-30/gluconolactonase/LRE family protein [Paenibacillus sp. CC-CFT747]|nr:SMP-30/gluconolactonase/LRE family protein [Paenibacillus sp. CC-CFT747]